MNNKIKYGDDLGVNSIISHLKIMIKFIFLKEVDIEGVSNLYIFKVL